MEIPKRYKVGGQPIEVRNVERCDCNCAGIASVTSGYIEIADLFDKDTEQSYGSKKNTFYHELVHTILQTMGESELNENEKFVCSFSSFLCEALESAEFYEP